MISSTSKCTANVSSRSMTSVMWPSESHRKTSSGAKSGREVGWVDAEDFSKIAAKRSRTLMSRSLQSESEVDGSVAVAAVEVEFVGAHALPFQESRQFAEAAKKKFEGPSRKPARRRPRCQAAWAWLETIRSTPCDWRNAAAAATTVGGVGRGGKPVDDRAEPHFAELFVAGQRRIEQNGPADGLSAPRDSQSDESRVVFGVKDSQASRRCGRPPCRIHPCSGPIARRSSRGFRRPARRRSRNRVGAGVGRGPGRHGRRPIPGRLGPRRRASNARRCFAGGRSHSAGRRMDA